MNKQEILKQTKFQTTAPKGISMEESILLASLPRISKRKDTTDGMFVTIVKKYIELVLKRTNVTSKDMRNAIVGMIKW